MRPCSTQLRSFLDNWTSATPAMIADLYIFSLVTGETFYYSGFQTPVGAPLPEGIVTNAATTVGSNVLGSNPPLPPWLTVGLTITDLTNPAAIPPGTTVTALNTGGTAGLFTLSNATVSPGVGSGDVLALYANFILGPRFSRTKMKVEVGPQIDELNIDLYASNDDILGMNAGGNITWQSALFHGLFDGAYCELLRAFLTGAPPTPPQVVGTITWFYGRIGDVDVGRTRTSIRVKSLLDLLTVQMPRRLFQSACNHIFGEPGVGMCGYDRVNGLNAAGSPAGPGAIPLTCDTGSTQGVIYTLFVPEFPTSYDNGTIIGTSGLNNGFSRTIGRLVSGSPSAVYFLKPFIFPVVANVDTFQLLPGCDHTLDTCTNVFNNEARYGGFPFIPPPETAV